MGDILHLMLSRAFHKSCPRCIARAGSTRTKVLSPIRHGICRDTSPKGKALQAVGFSGCGASGSKLISCNEKTKQGHNIPIPLITVFILSNGCIECQYMTSTSYNIFSKLICALLQYLAAYSFYAQHVVVQKGGAYAPP